MAVEEQARIVKQGNDLNSSFEEKCPKQKAMNASYGYRSFLGSIPLLTMRYY